MLIYYMLNRYYTHESFSKPGWLFGTSMIPRTTNIIPKNIDDKVFVQQFITIINNQLIKAFEDKKKIIERNVMCLNYKNNEDNANRYYFGLIVLNMCSKV